ncbi:hypothetical protein BG004_007719, partial [Podila humilis]
MGTNQSMHVRLQKKPKMTQQELQRQYQRNLSEQQVAEHLSARQALENSMGQLARGTQDFKQIPGINGNAPSVIASLANNESFYQQRPTNNSNNNNSNNNSNGTTTAAGTVQSSSADPARAGRQNFRWIDGRRHHNTEGAPYLLPNDIDEMD